MPNGQLANRLLGWYHLNARQLPWRGTADPYRIWLSEIMLQQTQVSTVIPYYIKFLEAYPTVQDLANADEQDVLKLWEGLGYYSRAKRLIACSKLVVEKHAGHFPQNYDDIIKLPGIGSYTAGAILSIAFNKRLPAVDGNVLRVVSRYFGDASDIASPKTKANFEVLLQPIIPPSAGDFNQALIELGALICRPKNPDCQLCPLKGNCTALSDQLVDKLPIKSSKKKAVVHQIEVAVIMHSDRYLLYKKPRNSLLGGFWAFPHVDQSSTIIQMVAEEFNLAIEPIRPLGSVKHVFTHQIWEMTVKLYLTDAIYSEPYIESRWLTLAQFDELPISTAMKKVISLIKNQSSLE